MTEPLLQTAFHAWHREHGGRLVDFAGWDMPVQYTSITEEHTAVRTSVGLFDIAHMGRLVFRGPDACGLLDRLVTNDVASIECGQVRYALVCREDGGILDDVLVYRFDDDYLLVVNASNRLKIVEWIESHRVGYDVEVVDRTLEWSMVAVQGPGSLEEVLAVTDVDVSTMGYYRCAAGDVLGHPGRVSRTGYTQFLQTQGQVTSRVGFRARAVLAGRDRSTGDVDSTGLGNTVLNIDVEVIDRQIDIRSHIPDQAGGEVGGFFRLQRLTTEEDGNGVGRRNLAALLQLTIHRNRGQLGDVFLTRGRGTETGVE